MSTSALLAKIKAAIPKVLMGGLLVAGTVICPQEPVSAQAYPPAYTTSNPLGGYTNAGSIYSLGFFFDTSSDVDINALGFSSQQAWGSNTTYTVKLWSYVNAGATPADYTELASLDFTQGVSYPFSDGYFWQPLPASLQLTDSQNTDPGDLRGYVIAAIGDFSNQPGNVQFEVATATFDPRILIAGNGYDTSDSLSGFYPVPIFEDTPVGSNGYFNANFSFTPAPGPLPVLGAAAAFSWSRRLRRRVRPSQ